MPDNPSSAGATRSDRLAALYRGGIDEAVAGSVSLAGRLARAARAALLERERSARLPAERDAAVGALRQLVQREADFAAALPAALRQAIEEGPQPPRARPAGGGVMELSFDQLELMDESEVQNRVELARAQQLAMHAAEHALAELNPYICAAQGLPSVRPERNPLRPDIYIRALQDAVARTAVAQVVRLAWLRPMYDARGPELAGIYEREARRLAGAGVEPVGYAMVPPAGGLARTAANGLDSLAPAVDLGDEALLTVGRLRQLLAGELDAPHAAPPRSEAVLGTASLLAGLSGALPAADAGAPAADFAPTAPAAYDLLGDLDRIGDAIGRLAQRQGGQPAPASARGAGQSLGVEVVALMME
ncbi:DUF1631 family protein [Xylophilus sp.]|uniref:DUF1631 family protein n=1 Tax=Xylophilus sp. TaxID=2653893 RepID=UPI0013B73913|nr:DUF1631 family protein [Xylophilus sp.]KAF1049269.1 MAG: hypothetical protein GAK38_00723 [Xylophilus sp.]